MLQSPMTPRGPSRRLTTTNTNTTPSRHPTLIAPLNIKPLPSSLYTDLLEDDFAPQREKDLIFIQETIDLMRNKSTEATRSKAEALAEVSEEKRSIEDLTKQLGEVAMEMVKTVKKEREEVESAKEIEAKYGKVGRTLRVRLDAVKADIAEVEIQLTARRALKAKQKAAFLLQANKNKPELAFFEDKLGLKIRGTDVDVVQFKFNNLDPSSYARAFSFDINASKPNYTLNSTSPASFLPSPILETALTQLNSSRNLYGFISEMRNLFKEEVVLEKMGLQGSLENEAVVQRNLLREKRGK